jgi:broad specificity phosphatase PhoE
MVKKIICIRHGQATHNVDHKIRGTIAYHDPIHRDSSLVKEGENEAKNLNSEIHKLNFDTVLVSPLTRTIQTCLLATKNIKKPIIAIEWVREYPCGVHTPNNRKSVSFLKDKYTNIDFSEIEEDDDTIWDPVNKETKKQLDYRIEKFKEWINKRQENTFVLFSHASFISRFLGYTKYEHIKHCYPYVIEV